MSVIHPMENAIIFLAYVVCSKINQLTLFIQKDLCSDQWHTIYFIIYFIVQMNQLKIGEFYTFLHISTQNQMFTKFNDLILMVIKKIGKKYL